MSEVPKPSIMQALPDTSELTPKKPDTPGPAEKPKLSASPTPDAGVKPNDKKSPLLGSLPGGLPGLETPGLPRPNGIPGPDTENKTKPDDGSAPNGQFTSIDKVDTAGNSVNLASMIITANANPFMDKLPKPLQPPEGGDGEGDGSNTPAVTVPDAPPDPFDEISLMGIVYNSKMPMALISTGTDKTLMVRKGDVISGKSGETIKVVKISRDNVELLLAGSNDKSATHRRAEEKSKDTKLLSLPSIIDYASKSADNSSSKSGVGDTLNENAPTTSAKPMPSSPSKAASSPKTGALLDNLTKLMEHPSTTGSGSRPSSTP
jgi:hypothetical protein